MHPLTIDQMRASIINGTKGDAKRLGMPKGLDATRWEDLDYLGWVDPTSPTRGCLVAEHGGRLVGVLLRVPKPGEGPARSRSCQLCTTAHSGGGVGLMVAPRAGARGRALNTLGTYICADFGCSLYARGLKRPQGMTIVRETLSTVDQVERLTTRLHAFVASIVEE